MQTILVLNAENESYVLFNWLFSYLQEATLKEARMQSFEPQNEVFRNLMKNLSDSGNFPLNNAIKISLGIPESIKPKFEMIRELQLSARGEFGAEQALIAYMFLKRMGCRTDSKLLDQEVKSFVDKNHIKKFISQKLVNALYSVIEQKNLTFLSDLVMEEKLISCKGFSFGYYKNTLKLLYDSGIENIFSLPIGQKQSFGRMKYKFEETEKFVLGSK